MTTSHFPVVSPVRPPRPIALNNADPAPISEKIERSPAGGRDVSIAREALARIVRNGSVDVVWPHERVENVNGSKAPHVRVRIEKPGYGWKLALDPSYYLPAGFVQGHIRFEDGDMRALLELMSDAIGDAALPTIGDRLRAWMQPVQDLVWRTTNRTNSAKNVQFHYDLSNDFFERILDPLMQYSCAYFEPWDISLADAQERKIAHILAKLDIGAESTVLDIGSGWGALVARCAALTRRDVVGVTLSRQQLAYASRRWQAPNIQFLLQDYRDHSGRYDRIVSVGMLEHVNASRYDEYFARIRSLLAPGGTALVQTIAHRGPPSPINPWIRRHIFPGSYLPSLSQLTAAIERQGLWVLDCENIRLHYAKTLQAWHRRFEANQDEFAREYGDEFVRAWTFYLASCELGFRSMGLTVYQLLVASEPTAAPLARTYMFERERSLLRPSGSPRPAE